MAGNGDLPVPVLSNPHWRVRFRPDVYEEELVPTLRNSVTLIEETKVSLRGWDYPHLSNRESEQARGANWIASWSSFASFEYWRFYQSGQFLHLFSVSEFTVEEWKEQLRARARAQLNWGRPPEFDWTNVPGFFSVLNFLYTVTEIFEFASRLCQKGIYQDKLNISIEIKKIRGFVLVHEPLRAWMHYYASTEDNLGKEWQLSREDLLTQSREHSLAAARWFFERFGWSSASDAVLRSDQEAFLSRRF